MSIERQNIADTLGGYQLKAHDEMTKRRSEKSAMQEYDENVEGVPGPAAWKPQQPPDQQRSEAVTEIAETCFGGSAAASVVGSNLRTAAQKIAELRAELAGTKRAMDTMMANAAANIESADKRVEKAETEVAQHHATIVALRAWVADHKKCHEQFGKQITALQAWAAVLRKALVQIEMPSHLSRIDKIIERMRQIATAALQESE